MFSKEESVREQAEKRLADGHTVYTFPYSPLSASSEKLADCIEAVESAGLGARARVTGSQYGSPVRVPRQRASLG